MFSGVGMEVRIWDPDCWTEDGTVEQFLDACDIVIMTQPRQDVYTTLLRHKTALLVYDPYYILASTIVSQVGLVGQAMSHKGINDV
jgi:hypothetical protein